MHRFCCRLPADRGQAKRRQVNLIVLKLAFMSHQEISVPADTSVR
ncbi:hypothetical protein ALP99_102549 [Pseudomonas syringae pv. tomato]|uniref:Uncharacterized protein n=1 Tax=Pseudomonas syringae pv. maculicola TaxID=59511 RepID=A0A3M6CAP6_PSEYM|nr:Unknown protein sequence [Pseudomonas amygdali pv. lachrymans]KPW36519.1 hypothetical protein ALO87_102453 [Pseudomonas syringae pv. apii]KPW46889.1 hypothetical protein ALO86_102163 [Pseudomonas syringae pv. berberidis]RMM12048.1 hypothetical protein ALQ85_102488 [Pseudomonas syringae]RMQ66679.1 hypothetical protein ALP99_102549 [Pseudomonas syringae pv. tomato]RMR29687.1 hypothetical protein ALP87_102682 [Pseudomonas syringae pv. coriandricola]RMV40788.1 hypothetical protein ALP13_103671